MLTSGPVVLHVFQVALSDKVTLSDKLGRVGEGKSATQSPPGIVLFELLLMNIIMSF